MIKEKMQEFILINHYFMTYSEMAEELNTTPANVGRWCKELGVQPITKRERATEFIIKHQYLTAEQIAEKMNMSLESVTTYIKELELPILTNKQKSIADRSANSLIRKTVTKPRSVTKEEFIKLADLPQEYKDYIRETTGINITGNNEPIKRVAGVYNQTGSPLTDELRGIITTKRVEVSAKDAFFK